MTDKKIDLMAALEDSLRQASQVPGPRDPSKPRPKVKNRVRANVEPDTAPSDSGSDADVPDRAGFSALSVQIDDPEVEWHKATHLAARIVERTADGRALTAGLRTERDAHMQRVSDLDAAIKQAEHRTTEETEGARRWLTDFHARHRTDRAHKTIALGGLTLRSRTSTSVVVQDEADTIKAFRDTDAVESRPKIDKRELGKLLKTASDGTTVRVDTGEPVHGAYVQTRVNYSVEVAS